MHEIKSPFLILMEEQSYLAQSLESAFEKQNVKVKIVTIAEASSIVISEKPSGYLICTSPELLKKAVSVKVMVDQAIKNKTPVFIMGNIDELELLWETLPQQMVMDVFTRPITVGDMVDNVCTQMNDFYQLKKRTATSVVPVVSIASSTYRLRRLFSSCFKSATKHRYSFTVISMYSGGSSGR